MNLYRYIDEKVNIENISQLDKDKHEIAIVRMVLKELSNIFYRDYTFFLNKENLIDRGKIYNKRFDLSNINDFSIVCKSYCEIIKKLLKENYDIDSELISTSNDEFRHADLIIKTKEGKDYIVDPLSDLLEMQIGLRTNNFASEEYYNKIYAEKVENISFLNKKELEEIDDKIGYKNSSVYLDDFLELLKIKLNNIEKILMENEDVSIDLLGSKYDGQKIADNKKTELKLRFISKYLNNRKNINGVVELLMFSNIIKKSLFTEEEQARIKVSSFFVDGQDIKDENIRRILETEEERKRGVVISCDERNFLFSLNSKTLEYTNEEWNKIISENRIFIKPRYDVKLLKYLKENGVDRNIVHNNEFLRLFGKFEKSLMDRGFDLETIKKHIVIRDGMILTKLRDKNILYRIEDKNLVVEDYKRNIKHVIFYKDEGRDIYYEVEPILNNVNIEKESEKYAISDTEFEENAEKIFKELSKNVKKSEKRKFVVVGGQAGAGKTNLVLKKNKEFEEGSIIINQDELREEFPEYLYKGMIDNYDERTIYLILRPYVNKLVEKIIDKSIENKYNVIFETAVSYAEPIIEYTNNFKKEGYETEISILVVDEIESRLSMLKRYSDLLEKDGICRRASKMSENAHKIFNDNIKVLHSKEIFDNVEIYIRNVKETEEPVKVYSEKEDKKEELLIILETQEENSYKQNKNSFIDRYKKILRILEKYGEYDKIRELNHLMYKYNEKNNTYEER